MSGSLNLIDMLRGEDVSGLMRSTAAALVAGVWQGVVLCAVTGLTLKLAAKSMASLRFTAWAAVFAVSVSLPFLSLPQLGSLGRVGEAAISHLALDARWSYVLAGLWLVAGAHRLVQLLLQGFGLRSLWKGALPIATDAPLKVNGRRVELCTSAEVDRPSVIGFLAPKILIPTWLFEQLTAVELNHIVLHELEHLRRRDDWVNLLQKVGLVLLPLNPALFWIDRRLSTERELACDDGVLEQTKMPRAYAASLASIAERRLDVERHGRVGALALAWTGLRRQRSELGARIESILGRRSPVNRALAGALTGIFVTGIAGAGVGLARAPRLVSFGPAAVPQQAVLRPRTTTPREVVSQVAKNSQVGSMAKFPTANFQDVSFREPAKVRINGGKAVVRKPIAAARIQHVSQQVVSPPSQRLLVLTSWQDDSPVSRVVVQTSDGKFFLAPYAAVPTQAGWLLVQL